MSSALHRSILSRRKNQVEIEKHSDKKLITVWLTNADQQDAGLLSWLKCQYPK